MHMCIHKQDQKSLTEIKYKNCPVNKENQKLYLPEQKQLGHKLENKTKARCQLGIIVKKIILTNSGV